MFMQYAAKTYAHLVKTDTLLCDQATSSRNLEMQVGLLANALNNFLQETLSSDTKINLIYSKEIPKLPIKAKEEIMDKKQDEKV